jgi:hypothetical protein
MQPTEAISKLKQLKVAKWSCQNSLLFQTRYNFKNHQGRKFVVGDHHRKICDVLEKVLAGEITKLIIEVAPRYGKTELAVKQFIAHGLALNPASKYIHLSYSNTLALDNSEEVKDLVQESFYQELFPEVQIKKDSKAKNKWYTTAGGGVYATAAAGQVTGFGAGQVDEETTDRQLTQEEKEVLIKKLQQQEDNELTSQVDELIDSIIDAEIDPILKKKKFGGAIVIDDSIKPEDADSDTIRERVNSRFDSTIRNRTNSRKTPIIIIGQRLHPNDLAGYVQKIEPGVWTVISLPALYVNEAGELCALWPHKHTVEELLALKQINDIVFERQYQQNPKPKTGLLFPIQDLHFYDPDEIDLSDPDFKYMPVDPANEGGDDFAAIDTRLIGDRVYVPNVLYNTEGTDHNEPAVVEMVLAETIRFVGVEGVFGWADVANRIRDILNEKEFDCELRVLRPRTGKHARITTRASWVRNNMWFRKDWEQFPQYAKFIRNLTSYLKIQEAGKKNKHDEAPDVCEMASNYYERNFPQLWPSIKEKK